MSAMACWRSTGKGAIPTGPLTPHALSSKSAWIGSPRLAGAPLWCSSPSLRSAVFAGSSEVDRALGWQPGTLNPWLEQQGLLQPGQAKPSRPKEAVQHAMVQKRQPRSSSVYRQLSRSVGFSRCTDPAFTDLKATLQQWFPQEGFVMTMASPGRFRHRIDRGELGSDRGGFGRGSRGAANTAKTAAGRQACHGGQVP